MSDSFEYRAQARNPVSYLAFGLGFAVVVTNWALRLSVLSWTFSLLCLLALLVRLFLNPRSGFRLDDRTIEVFAPGRHRIIPLSATESVRISQAETGLSCDLSLTSGEGVPLPSQLRIRPDDLAGQFRTCGVLVIA
jgi:hypothetical protein